MTFHKGNPSLRGKFCSLHRVTGSISPSNIRFLSTRFNSGLSSCMPGNSMVSNSRFYSSKASKGTNVSPKKKNESLRENIKMKNQRNSIPILIKMGFVSFIFSVIYLICSLSGHMDFFHQFLLKSGMRIGCSQLSRFGLNSELCSFIFFTLNLWWCGFFQDLDLMKHFGRSGSAGSNSNGDNMGGSGGSSRGSGWTHFDLDVLAENSAASAEDDRRGENRNSTSDPAEQRNGASSSHIFPYQADEVIGGDSVNAIKSRLLAKTPSPSFYEIEQARIDAQDRFEVKVEIIRQMAPLHPEGDWLGRGARALENPRTATGEHSLEKLHTLLSDLESRGVNSESFSQLKGKVPLRRGGDEHSTT
ncbi:hypothetical protein RND71_008004 [Anisodus tanguticus]|uniref:DUF8018 domain-containing protein n=1 Tax=Anisodus tanguticus TaxID=243964 RepID=A0AAE1SMY1_9SOLA|nr:hypothetical protein RND71_008004 [Anisodus tanguticus]